MALLPSPSLNSFKGVLVLILAVAVGIAILTNTRIGSQLQGALNGAAASLPI